jgi:hypothetical protein
MPIVVAPSGQASCFRRSRKTFFCTLPVEVFGRGPKTIRFGALKRANWARTWLVSSTAVAGTPSRSATNDRDFAPLLVRRGDDRGLEHRRMAGERVLDLDRRDVLAAGNDDVLGAVAQLDVEVGIHHAEVAGAKPAVGAGLLRRFFVAVVAEHQVVAAHRDLAHRLGIGRHVVAVAVDDANLARDDVADALARLQSRLLGDAQLRPVRAPLADDARPVGLGQAIEVGDVHAELGEALEQRRGRRRAAGADPHRMGELPGLRVPDGHRQHRRCGAEVGHARLAHVLPDQTRLEPRQAQVDAADRGHRPAEAPAVAVEHRQGPEEHRIAIDRHVQRHRERLQIGAPVVVHHPLRTRRRAAGVVDGEERALVDDRHRERGGRGNQCLELVTQAAGADHAQSGVNGGRGLLRGWHDSESQIRASCPSAQGCTPCRPA